MDVVIDPEGIFIAVFIPIFYTDHISLAAITPHIDQKTDELSG
jgi:hypothetical protein